MEDRGVREQTSSSPIKAILFHRCPRGPSDPSEGDAQEKECHRERSHGDNQRTDPLRLSEFFEVLKSDPEDDTCPSNARLLIGWTVTVTFSCSLNGNGSVGLSTPFS
jgi:hypothetical protein